MRRGRRSALSGCGGGGRSDADARRTAVDVDRTQRFLAAVTRAGIVLRNLRTDRWGLEVVVGPLLLLSHVRQAAHDVVASTVHHAASLVRQRLADRMTDELTRTRIVRRVLRRRLPGVGGGRLSVPDRRIIGHVGSRVLADAEPAAGVVDGQRAVGAAVVRRRRHIRAPCAVVSVALSTDFRCRFVDVVLAVGNDFRLRTDADVATVVVFRDAELRRALSRAVCRGARRFRRR